MFDREMLRATTPWKGGRSVEALIDEPEPGWLARYECPRHHDFTRRLAQTAAAPATWQCDKHGDAIAVLCGQTHGPLWEPDGTEPETGSADTTASERRTGKTPWEMLRERRTIPELETLLAERLNWLDSTRQLGE